VISKKPASANKPAAGLHTVTYGANKSTRKSVKSTSRGYTHRSTDATS
jgi:large subunit ribosomal protein L28e